LMLYQLRIIPSDHQCHLQLQKVSLLTAESVTTFCDKAIGRRCKSIIF
jgi:hypothetical protein